MIDNIIDRWTECGVSLGSTCAIGSLDVGILASSVRLVLWDSSMLSDCCARC